MKNSIKVITAIIIVSVFLFTGCGKKEIQKSKFKETDFEFVGEVHNFGLLQSYNSLKSYKISKSKSSAELIEEMGEVVISKILTDEFDSTLLEVAISQKKHCEN